MVNSEWRTVKLEEVAREITVGFVGSMVQEYVADGIPFLRSQNIEPFLVNKKDLKFISPAFHKKIKKSALAPGDVIIVRTGKPGACALVPEWLEDANCSDVVIVRCGPELDARFLVYYVNSVASHHVASHTVGAVQQHFNVGAARTLKLNLPSLNQQRRIAHILGTLDDKIELNRQLTPTLEQLARTLFQSWFVDFDPVQARASGEPEESICRRLGLTPELLALFPATFDSSAMGSIPTGWKITSIGEAVDVVGGGTPSTAIEEYWHKGTYHWATPKDLSGLNSPMLLDTDRKITEKGVRNISSGLLPRDTVLLSSRAPVGYLAISAVPIAINQGFIALRCNGPISPYYAYMWCLENMGAIKSRASGTTFQEISKKSFRPMPVLLPDKQIMLEFTALIELLFNQIEAGAKEAATLASLRDELLPKLLSGQIKLS